MNEQDQRVRNYYNNLKMPEDKLAQLLKVDVQGVSDAQDKLGSQVVSSVQGKAGSQVTFSSQDMYAAQDTSDVLGASMIQDNNGVEDSCCGQDSSTQLQAFPETSLAAFGGTGVKESWWPMTVRDTGLKVAAAAALIVMVSMWMHNTGSDSELMQRTVREVAMNHSTRLEPEYHGETLAKLDNSMQQLPFALVLPKAIDNAYELIGSRYCSLGGALAAHVKLKDSHSGKPMSLFVTGNSADLKEIRSQQTTIEGVDVKFWREGGLFFALAQQS